MPLYLEDFEVPAGMPLGFLGVLFAIDELTKDRPVNPAIALVLLREFLVHFVPDHAALFAVSGQPTWEKLWTLYAELIGASKGQDEALMHAARLVGIVVRHTTRPPRTITFPAHVEVESFGRIATLLGLHAPAPKLPGRRVGADLFTFCKYCWLPLNSHGVCRQHSTNKCAEVLGQEPRCGTATLKQVHRLHSAFELAIGELATKEELAFHTSGFSEAVLVPPSGLMGWLEQRRPNLARLVSAGPVGEQPDHRSLLLRTLYGSDATDVAQAIAGSDILLTPVTLRAEAWLAAWACRPRWGGGRAGAGRRPVANKTP